MNKYIKIFIKRFKIEFQKKAEKRKKGNYTASSCVLFSRGFQRALTARAVNLYFI